MIGRASTSQHPIIAIDIGCEYCEDCIWTDVHCKRGGGEGGRGVDSVASADAPHVPLAGQAMLDGCVFEERNAFFKTC